MQKPQMLIGTDRLELHEFLARRREILNGFNSKWMRLAIAATVTHALIVQAAPILYSRFFVDKDSASENKLDNED